MRKQNEGADTYAVHYGAKKSLSKVHMYVCAVHTTRDMCTLHACTHEYTYTLYIGTILGDMGICTPTKAISCKTLNWNETSPIRHSMGLEESVHFGGC
jgi:hypothetical protein